LFVITRSLLSPGAANDAESAPPPSVSPFTVQVENWQFDMYMTPVFALTVAEMQDPFIPVEAMLLNAQFKKSHLPGGVSDIADAVIRTKLLTVHSNIENVSPSRTKRGTENEESVLIGWIAQYSIDAMPVPLRVRNEESNVVLESRPSSSVREVTARTPLDREKKDVDPTSDFV
jgi:hypothetical protein